MDYLDYSIEILKSSNYRLTDARQEVLKVLDKAVKPMSAYDIVNNASVVLEPITVYRVLELFEKLKLIHKSLVSGGYVACTKFEDKGCHHLVVCKSCESFDEFTEKHNHKAEQIKFRDLPFKEVCHLYELQGVCNSCA